MASARASVTTARQQALASARSSVLSKSSARASVTSARRSTRDQSSRNSLASSQSSTPSSAGIPVLNRQSSTLSAAMSHISTGISHLSLGSSIFDLEDTVCSSEDEEADFDSGSKNRILLRASTAFLSDELCVGFRGRLHGQLKSNDFAAFMSTIIVVNIAVMIYETDQNAACANHDSMSQCENVSLEVLNYIFLGIYTVEVLLRLYVLRLPLFCNKWDLLDTVVVVSGFMDVAVRELVEDDVPGPSMSLLRTLRVLRLLRAVRIVRKIPELHAMLRGFISAMRSMFWGLVMVVAVMVLFAVLCVELIHPISLRIHHDNEFCREAFGSIWYCILLFFQTLVAGDSWGDCVIPVVKDQWWAFLIFGCALACIQLGFLNLILAVIVQRATQAAQEDEEEVRKDRERSEQKATRSLSSLFASIDTTGSGAITRDELLLGFDANEEINRLFGSLDMNRRDVGMLFELMDTEDEGELGYDYMIENLRTALHGDDRMGIRMLRLQTAEIARTMKKMQHESFPTRSSGHASTGLASSQPAAWCGPFEGSDNSTPAAQQDAAEEQASTPLADCTSLPYSQAGFGSNPQAESNRSIIQHGNLQDASDQEVSALRSRLQGEFLEIRRNMDKMNESVLQACQAFSTYQGSSCQRILDLLTSKESRPNESGLHNAQAKPLSEITARSASNSSPERFSQDPPPQTPKNREIGVMTPRENSSIPDEVELHVVRKPSGGRHRSRHDASFGDHATTLAHDGLAELRGQRVEPVAWQPTCYGQSESVVSHRGHTPNTDRGVSSGQLSFSPCTPRVSPRARA